MALESIDSPGFRKAFFISRPNRFLGIVNIKGRQVLTHIRDPGRLKELLVPGAEVYLKPVRDRQRKTRYSLVAVSHGGVLVSIDSQLPNIFIGLILGTMRWPRFEQARQIRREVKVGNSRLDFSFRIGEATWFAEVKGCTLVRDGMALFPDAPTTRGARHVRKLAELVERGFKAAVFFVIQRSDAVGFSPNREMDPDFATALEESAQHGVELYALATLPVLGKGLTFLKELPVCL